MLLLLLLLPLRRLVLRRKRVDAIRLLHRRPIGRLCCVCCREFWVSRDGGRVLGDEWLDALDGEPVGGPVDAFGEGDLFLAEDAVKVEFLVLDEVDGAGGLDVGEGEGPAEGGGVGGCVPVEGLDVEDAEGLVDVGGGHGRAPAMAHEAGGFLGKMRWVKMMMRGRFTSMTWCIRYSTSLASAVATASEMVMLRDSAASWPTMRGMLG